MNAVPKKQVEAADLFLFAKLGRASHMHDQLQALARAPVRLEDIVHARVAERCRTEFPWSSLDSAIKAAAELRANHGEGIELVSPGDRDCFPLDELVTELQTLLHASAPYRRYAEGTS